MAYQTYDVTGKSGFTIYNIQAKTKQDAKKQFKKEAGEPALKAELA